VGSLSPWHWAILAIVIVVLFGYKRLPDAARSLGKSLRIFKTEVRELQNGGKPETSATQAAPAQPVESERVEPPAADGRTA
jgi:sec-independent protein translocase protein TatA